MMKALTLAIPSETAARLDELAAAAYRRPKDQAALLLVEAIERAARVDPGQSAHAPTGGASQEGRQ